MNVVPAARLERAGQRATSSTLAVVCLATLLTLMNYTAPMVVLPQMAAALGAGPSGETWILNGMSVGLAALLLTAGSLADNYGRKAVFLTGVAVLAAASLLCAAAPSTAVFVVARLLQGAAGAAVIAAGLGLVAHAVTEPRARARATAVWGAMLGGGIALGPLVSASASALGDWRMFYLALAVVTAALAIGGGLFRMPESRSDRARRIDLPGMLVLTGGVALLVTTLTVGRGGWLRPGVWGLAALTVVVLVLFVVLEARRREPMLELGLFRNPRFVAAGLGAFANGAGTIALMSYLPTLLQHALTFTPTQAAALFCAWAGTSFLVALRARRLTRWIRRGYELPAGLVLAAAGAAAMLGALDGGSWLRLLPGLFIAGVSSGVLNALLAGQAVATVPTERSSMGSGANNTARYIGSSLGVALIVTLLSSVDNAGPDLALIVSAGFSLAGATAVLLAGTRRG